MAERIVVFDPEGKVVEAPEGESLLEAAGRAGVTVDSACGGQGTCGRCRLRLLTGDIGAEASAYLSAEDRAEGAFLVSARRENGKTQWVRITSLAGEPCRVKSNWAGKVRVLATENVTLRQSEDGVCEIGLAKGQSVLMYTADKAPDPVVKPVSAADGRCNVFGLKAARKEK